MTDVRVEFALIRIGQLVPLVALAPSQRVISLILAMPAVLVHPITSHRLQFADHRLEPVMRPNSATAPVPARQWT